MCIHNGTNPVHYSIKIADVRVHKLYLFASVAAVLYTCLCCLAEAIATSIPKTVSFITDGKVGPIKEENCVPHDLGDPGTSIAAFIIYAFSCMRMRQLMNQYFYCRRRAVDQHQLIHNAPHR